MKYTILLLPLILSGVLSCRNIEFEEKQQILESALQFSFSDERLLSPQTLTQATLIKDSSELTVQLDSIWIIPNRLTAEHLAIEGFKFKITTFEEICALPELHPIPYILVIEITEYERSTLAKVKLETTCKSQSSDDCKFGIMCGSSLGLELRKINGLWKPEIKAQSIN